MQENRQVTPPNIPVDTPIMEEKDFSMIIGVLSIVSIVMIPLSHLLWLFGLVGLGLSITSVVLAYKYFKMDKKMIFVTICVVVAAALTIVNIGNSIVSAIQEFFYSYMYGYNGYW